MDDVQRALAEAWKRLGPRLQRDPDELRRRRARRRSKLIESPPRAWCLAVRATDRRLDRYSLDYPDPADLEAGNRVRLDSDALEFLCRPVHLASPGEPLREVARLLGTTIAGLTNGRLAGVFQTNYIPARRGQQPLLCTPLPLDPAARGFATTDPIWSATVRNVPFRIPDGIEQTLTRVPEYRPWCERRYRDKSGLHPEHPDVDPPAPKWKSKRLPPPPPDPVWYKWKGDEYIGYDWRAAERNPLFRINYERHERKKAKERVAARRRYRENPPPSQAKGSLRSYGWRWLCPGCGRRVRVLFYPLPRWHLLPAPMWAAMNGEAAEWKRVLAQYNLAPSLGAVPTFACEKCHRVRYMHHSDHAKYWNAIVAYLSAGLLYGHEVARPEWFKPQRKIAYKPQINCEPSRRLPQVEAELLAGRTIRQIADDFGLRFSTVQGYAQKIYKRSGVRGLRALLKKHSQVPPPTRADEVRRRLAEGQTIVQIARTLGMSRHGVERHVRTLQKRGVTMTGVRPRARERAMLV